MAHHHSHGGLGIFMLVTALAFAFGPRVARYVVGSVLLAGLAFFGYVMFRIITGTV